MSRNTRRHPAPALESLEGRALMAVSSFVTNAADPSIANILSTAANVRSSLQTQLSNADFTGTYSPRFFEQLATNASAVNVLVLQADNQTNAFNMTNSFFRSAAIQAGIQPRDIATILYLGGTGNDTFSTGVGLPLIAFDRGGNNRISGSSYDDLIVTGTGRDQIDSRFGDDLVISDSTLNFLNPNNLGDLTRQRIGAGDNIRGGGGYDIMLGGPGTNQFDGGNLGDLVITGNGSNSWGSDALDQVIAGFYNDTPAEDPNYIPRLNLPQFNSWYENLPNDLRRLFDDAVESYGGPLAN